MPRRKSVSQLVRRLRDGREALNQARLELARHTYPDGPAAIATSDLRWAQRLIEQRYDALLAYPGVVGVALGTRRVDGVDLREPCLTLFVRRKLSREALKRLRRPVVPRRIRAGRRTLPVDVVELGKVVKHATVGQSIGPVEKRLTGTVGAFAVELASGRKVAITAMHVTGLSEFPAGGQPAPALSIPSWFENQQAPAVGELLRGTRTGVDAAAILLRPSVQSVNRAPVVGALRGWRPIVHPDDLTTPVQLYGAVSRYREGRIRYTHVSIPEDRLQHAVLAEIQTAHGDSGAALVDPAGLILGFLFGLAPAQFGPLAVFSSAGGVLKRLGCDIPSS